MQDVYDDLLRKEGESTAMKTKYAQLMLARGGPHAPGYDIVNQRLHQLGPCRRCPGNLFIYLSSSVHKMRTVEVMIKKYEQVKYRCSKEEQVR